MTVENGKTDYVIVYSTKATIWEKEMAVLFRDTLEELTGASLQIMDDFERPERGLVRAEKELIIGNTNRANEYELDKNSYALGYRVFTDDHRIVFVGGSRTGLYMGISQFIKDHFSADIAENDLDKYKSSTLAVSADYDKTTKLSSSELPYLNVPAKDLTVVYNDSNEVEKYISSLFYGVIKSMTGTAPIFSDSVSNGKSLKVVTDTTIPGGDYKFAIADGNITVTASDYQGFGAALDYMMDAYDTKGQFFTLTNGIEHESNYKEHLTDVTASAEYAYSKVGSTRIMFYNVLFMGAASGYTHPPEARDYLQIEMLKLYRPDVVGFQEFRTGTIVGVNGETIGERDRFMEMLDDLGYVATIPQGDSRIDNSTHSCYVPVYYNPETTELVESDFYTYASQSNNMPKDYVNTPASIRDTKSMTWAVFKEKASGRQYIVISTHMVWQDKNLSSCQAMEALSTIEDLCRRYDAPLFMGGDLNSRVNNGKNYDYLIDAGMENARDVASFYSSDTFAAHTYPDYDKSIGMILPGAGMKIDTAKESIDHILIENRENVRINVFGVVADICTAAGSDHLPIFVDISFT